MRVRRKLSRTERRFNLGQSLSNPSVDDACVTRARRGLAFSNTLGLDWNGLAYQRVTSAAY